MPYKDKQKQQGTHKRWRLNHATHIAKYNKNYYSLHFIPSLRFSKTIARRHAKTAATDARKHFCQKCDEFLGHRTPSYKHQHPRCRKCAYERTPEIRQKNRQARLNRWENSQIKANDMRTMALGQVRKPNKPEKSLLALLEEIDPHNWRYIGDGSVFFGTLNPDFICNNQPKTIDLFGRYWHRNKSGLSWLKSELGRTFYLKQFGLSPLIVWDDELLKTIPLKEKLLAFISS